MTRPTFGTAHRGGPAFGQSRSAIDHVCIARWGFRCPAPGPHARPAAADPDTVPAFADDSDTPSLWTAPREETDR